MEHMSLGLFSKSNDLHTVITRFERASHHLNVKYCIIYRYRSMMAPDAVIYDYCVFQEVDAKKREQDGSPMSNTSEKYIEEAIEDAIVKKCDIINMSFARTKQMRIPSYEAKIKDAKDAGIIVVCAAGRGDGDASTDEVM